MVQTPLSSHFQEVIETVEALPQDDQALLVDIIRQRLIQFRRAQISVDVAEARDAYQRGEVRRGNVADLLGDVGEEEILLLTIGGHDEVY